MATEEAAVPREKDGEAENTRCTQAKADSGPSAAAPKTNQPHPCLELAHCNWFLTLPILRTVTGPLCVVQATELGIICSGNEIESQVIEKRQREGWR